MIEIIRQALSDAATLSLEDRVEIYNKSTELLKEMVGFPHPALAPQLIKAELVQGNDYNPNKVAPPEMGLLRLSVLKDGVTMPIVVCNNDKGGVTVVDGFHRTIVIKDTKTIKDSLHGYVPVVRLNKPVEERIAATVRHNMARGTHQTELSSKLVLFLREHAWSDARIGKELGMQPDEILRLKQISGLADAFKDREFSQAWEQEAEGLKQ